MTPQTMTPASATGLLPYALPMPDEYRQPAPGEWNACAGCFCRRGTEVHHREHKGMGGRHGAAKVASEANDNKIRLCRVCHAASHFEHVIEADGFHCGNCPRLHECFYGRVTMGEKAEDLAELEPLW